MMPRARYQNAVACLLCDFHSRTKEKLFYRDSRTSDVQSGGTREMMVDRHGIGALYDLK